MGFTFREKNRRMWIIHNVSDQSVNYNGQIDSEYSQLYIQKSWDDKSNIPLKQKGNTSVAVTIPPFGHILITSAANLDTRHNTYEMIFK